MSLLAKPSHSRIIYAGVDESNFGRIPEYYTLVLSPFPSDVVSAGYLDRKEEGGNHRSLWAYVRKRDYTFLTAEERDKTRLGKDFLGVAVASLLRGHVFNSRPIMVFVDALERSKFTRMRDAVAEMLSIERKLISFAQGDDEYTPLVHLADELAHYFFRHTSSDQQSTKYKNHRRELIL